jgi:hypothetical protein
MIATELRLGLSQQLFGIMALLCSCGISGIFVRKKTAGECLDGRKNGGFVWHYGKYRLLCGGGTKS